VTAARLSGRVAGVPLALGWVVAGTGHVLCLSGSAGEDADAVPGGGDVGGPGPAGLYFQLPPAGAAGDPGGGVQDLTC